MKKWQNILLLLLTALLASGCLQATEELDPTASFWKKVPAKQVSLVPQSITLPRGGSSKELSLQAATSGEKLLVRLSWPDATPDLAYTGDKFSDGAAIMFPLSLDPLPAPFMGDEENPVQIWHWRADWQFQKDQAEEIAKSYPAYADWYPPHEESYFQGVGRHPEPGRAAVYAAKGFGSLTRQPATFAEARGAYDAKEKKWRLVFAAPTAEVPLFSQEKTTLNPAVWDGASGEQGARKSVSMSWQEVVPVGNL